MTDIGISTGSFFLKENVEDCFAVIRKLGLEVVEVFLTTFSEYEKEYVESLLPRINGLNIHSVHSLNTHFEPELFNLSSRAENDAIQIMRKVLYGAKVFGAHFYTFHGQFRMKDKVYNIDFEKFGERLSKICSICGEYGVELCYENVNWAFYNYSGFFKSVKQYCPDLRATLDIKQAMLSKVDVYDYIKDMGDNIRTIHICDLTSNGTTCLPGQGTFDFLKFFDHLNTIGCKAPALLEVYSGNYQSYDELAKSIDFLHEVLYKVGR